jgi:cobyrinic acid a,c-diamide synthase
LKYFGKRVGIIRDKAFQFYYPENIEAFKNLGAAVIEISAIKDKKLPDLDLLYIGGGFPETSAHLLQKNASFRKSLKQSVNRGLSVYAECGGAIYLGRRLYFRGKTFSMTGIFNLDFDFSEKPRGHGYTILKITRNNPFFKPGTILKGHEFHYTAPKTCKGARLTATVQRGFGFDGKRDGLVYKNVFSTYSHINAFSISGWADSLLCS